MPQHDSAEHPVALDDPPVRARRRRRVVGQPRHPGREPVRRVDLVGRPQPETVLVLAGVLGTTNRASAWWVFGGPYYTSAAFPCANPPGYYTNLYYYGWMYPWYAYYNYSHGPYANWWWWGGYMTYANSPVPRPVPATVIVHLPADATLLFDGAPSAGVGALRSFYTTLLVPGQDYEYELTAEAIRNGEPVRVTERVIVRAGQRTEVRLLLPEPKK